jgi:hypothetical protein
MKGLLAVARTKREQTKKDTQILAPLNIPEMAFEKPKPKPAPQKVPVKTQQMQRLENNMRRKEGERVVVLQEQPEHEIPIKPVPPPQHNVKEYPFYNFLQQRSKWSFSYWRDAWRMKMHPDKVVMINFELNNGFFRHFLVVEKEGTFFYKEKQYIFDIEAKYYSVDLQLWCYDFHEGFTLPFKRKFPIAETKKLMALTGIKDIEYMVNPEVVNKFTTTKIIEAIMKGAELDAFMRQLRLMLIITMLTGIIHLLLFAYKTGMFSQIGGAVGLGGG